MPHGPPDPAAARRARAQVEQDRLLALALERQERRAQRFPPAVPVSFSPPNRYQHPSLPRPAPAPPVQPRFRFDPPHPGAIPQRTPPPIYGGDYDRMFPAGSASHWPPVHRSVSRRYFSKEDSDSDSDSDSDDDYRKNDSDSSDSDDGDDDGMLFTGTQRGWRRQRRVPTLRDRDVFANAVPRFEDEHEDLDPAHSPIFGTLLPHQPGFVIPGIIPRQPDVDGMSYEQRLAFFQDVEVGLSPSVLDSFPLIPFHKTEDNEDSCSVCLCEYEETETVMTLPCLHQFHPECIKGWLKSHTTCPICRVDLKRVQE